MTKLSKKFASLFLYNILPIYSLVLFPSVGIIKILVYFIKYLVNIILSNILNLNNNSNLIENHSKKVKHVQNQVLEWIHNGKKNKMCTGRPGWMSISWRTPIYKDTMTRININLNDIVFVDTEKQIVKVEPLMSMGELSTYLLNMGWIIPVVPEFDDLTVGGVICGAGVETSSHKYGVFADTCISYEIVLSDGRVVNCSKDENTDLFYAIPMSHGTLGFLVSATIRIIRARKYIKLEYIPVHSLNEAVSIFEAKTNCESGNEFVEGIMYSLDKGVVMVGNMAANPGAGKVNSMGRWYKPWFYKHVETFLYESSSSSSGQHIEYIPFRDYLHRHTKSIFWEMEIMLQHGNSFIFRYLFGWCIPVRLSLVLFLLPDWFKNMLDDLHVMQDFILPIEKLKKSLIFSHEQTQVYPIWLCPVKNKNVPGMSSSKIRNDEMYVDVGVYGISKLEKFNVEKTGKNFEKFCLQNGGYQAPYGDVFLTKEEFEQMFNHDLYFKVRKELKCENAFPEIYDKICRKSRR